MTLIYVSHLKFQKKCATCGNNIPKDEECWWDKETKLNYHNNCKPQALPLVASGKKESTEPAMQSTSSSALASFDYDIEGAYAELEQKYEDPFIVVELSRQKYEQALANWKAKTWMGKI
jgi:hypothetical protein